MYSKVPIIGKVWVFWEGHKIWKKSSLLFWQEHRVLCAQHRTCQKLDEDFFKKMWTSRIIQTLTNLIIFKTPKLQNHYSTLSSLHWGLDETLRLDEAISVSGLIELVITIEAKINGGRITLIGPPYYILHLLWYAQTI